MMRGTALLGLVLAGCPAADEDTGHETSTTLTPQGCAVETEADEYMLGLEKAGTVLKVRFVDALPAPPSRGDNEWIIDVLDVATSTPRDDFELEVVPWMTQHMHGTAVACEVTKLDEPGRYELSPVNMWMPGIWDIQLHFALADETADRVDFYFCVGA